MKKIKAFVQILRWQNLMFIAITQLLFYYCIIKPQLVDVFFKPQLSNKYLFLIIVASIAIAGAGNIINDYFDIKATKNTKKTNY